MKAAMMAFGIAVGCNVDLLPADDAIAERRAVSGSSRDGFGWVGGADIGDGGKPFRLERR